MHIQLVVETVVKWFAMGGSLYAVLHSDSGDAAYAELRALRKDGGA